MKTHQILLLDTNDLKDHYKNESIEEIKLQWLYKFLSKYRDDLFLSKLIVFTDLNSNQSVILKNFLLELEIVEGGVNTLTYVKPKRERYLKKSNILKYLGEDLII